jgi:hypothetical protein
VPDIRYHVADLAARVALVAAGLGYSLLPRSAVATLATDPRDVTALELPWLDLTLQVYAVTLRRPARAATEFVATLTRADSTPGRRAEIRRRPRRVDGDRRVGGQCGVAASGASRFSPGSTGPP